MERGCLATWLWEYSNENLTISWFFPVQMFVEDPAFVLVLDLATKARRFTKDFCIALNIGLPQSFMRVRMKVNSIHKCTQMEDTNAHKSRTTTFTAS